MTSFEDSHYILLFRYTFMAHNLYSGFAIQNTFMSTVVLINEVSEVLQRHYLQVLFCCVPLDFCTTADFEVKYFFHEDTAGVLDNT